MQVEAHVLTDDEQVKPVAHALEKHIKWRQRFEDSPVGSACESHCAIKASKWEGRYYKRALKLGMSFEGAYSLLEDTVSEVFLVRRAVYEDCDGCPMEGVCDARD